MSKVKRVMNIDKLLKQINDDVNKFGKSSSVKDLVKVLKYSSDKYYNTSESVISDEVFDLLKEYLEKKDPENPFLSEVGAPISRDKVKLPFPMGSLDKIKTQEDIDKWAKKYSGPYMTSDKLDGISAQLYIDEDGKVKLYTRGNGIEGQDITHLIQYVISSDVNLKKIPKKTSIRGELILSKLDFEKLKDNMKNARNGVAGIVNSKTVDKDLARLVKFVAYNILYPSYPQDKQFKILESYGFQVVEHKLVKKLEFDELVKEFSERRVNANYEIDGIVVIDNNKAYKIVEGNPEYAIAFKTMLNDQVAIATVVDVVWDATMDGYLKPVVKIEPTKLVGVTIENVTAFNGKFVVENKINIGTKIKIIRSGDVIPHIVEVITPSKEPLMPDVPFKWTETNVDIELVDIFGKYKEIVTSKNIVFFFKTIGVKYMDIGIVTKLYNANYDTIEKILNADKKKLEKIDGLGNKMITKIFDGIYKALDKMTLIKFISASRILGRSVGERKLKLIVDKYPDLLQCTEDEDVLRDKLMTIKGYSTKTTDKVVENILEFKEFYKKINKIYDISHIMEIKKKVIKDTINDNKFNGMNIVFTGIRDKKIEEEIEKYGGKIGSGVTSKTTLLVYKSDDGSAKMKKAKELNIQMMNIEDFKEKYFK
jgi:NAD-dependent DNA ligase